MTSDTKKAQAFYTALLGWTTQVHDMGDVTYTVFMAGDKGISGMLQTPKEKADHVPSHWMSYICVENVEKTIEKAKALGASVTVPLTTVPDMGNFAVIWIQRELISPSGSPLSLLDTSGKLGFS